MSVLGIVPRGQACRLSKAGGRMALTRPMFLELRPKGNGRVILVHGCRQGTLRPAPAKCVSEPRVRVPLSRREERCYVL